MILIIIILLYVKKYTRNEQKEPNKLPASTSDG